MRTTETRAQALAAAAAAPAVLCDDLAGWIEASFARGSARTAVLLDRLETAALQASECSDIERRSVRAAALCERLQAAGIDVLPRKQMARDAPSGDIPYQSAKFRAQAGGAIFDMPLHGLGNSLMFRVLAVARQDVRHAALLHFRQAREILQAHRGASSLVATLCANDAAIVEYHGGTTLT